MTGSSSDQVDSLLDRLRAGDEGAFDELFPLIYDELRGLARRQRRRWNGNRTLNTTAILHEAYLKLSGHGPGDWEGRAHFLHAASRAMRHVLINYAERRGAHKRGGGRPPVPIEDLSEVLTDPRGSRPGPRLAALVTLNRALERLQEANASSSEVVECRVFGGMTIRETAEALDISEATVSRRWAVAQAWLRRELLPEAG